MRHVLDRLARRNREIPLESLGKKNCGGRFGGGVGFEFKRGGGLLNPRKVEKIPKHHKRLRKIKRHMRVTWIRGGHRTVQLI